MSADVSGKEQAPNRSRRLELPPLRTSTMCSSNDLSLASALIGFSVNSQTSYKLYLFR